MNESACIQDAAKLWNSVLEVGKTTLKQTPQFREAVKTCLTEGYAPLAIATAIHKTAIDDGHYSSECMGVGLNYDKIQSAVTNCKRPLHNKK